MPPPALAPRQDQSVAAVQTRPVRGERLVALDLLRGLIIVLMAIDHASYFVAHVHRSEFWGVPMRGYADPASFLTRFVTHLAAPGFFLLMGTSVVFLADARRREGWTTARVARFLALRGALLILLQHLVENPAWLLGTVGSTVSNVLPPVPGGGGEVLLHFGVLYALGGSMIFCALLIKARTGVLAGVGLGSILLAQAITPGPEQVNTLYSPAARLLAIPGHSGMWQVFYPLLPWFGVAALGMVFGRVLQRGGERVLRRAWIGGAVLLALFIGVRLSGGTFGNVHPYEGGGWIRFLNVTKYPPSLSFLLVTLGMNLLLLSALNVAKARLGGWNSPLMVFGQSALTFYLLHLYVYLAFGRPFPCGVTLPAMYAIWVLGLALLYPACRAWRAFKQRKPSTSMWRLF